MTTQAVPPGEAPDSQTPLVVSAPPVAEATPPITETPATPPVEAAPPTPTPPAVDPQLQAYISGLERQVREAKARADSEAIASSVANRQQELVNEYGLSPEQALTIAQREGRLTQEAAARVAGINAKWAYAAELAKQHKIPIDSLLQYNTPEAMDEAVAKLSSDSQKDARIAALEAQVAALTKGQVPAQTFENGRGQPVSGSRDYVERLRNGKPLPPSNEIDAMTARFLSGR